VTGACVVYFFIASVRYYTAWAYLVMTLINQLIMFQCKIVIIYLKTEFHWVENQNNYGNIRKSNMETVQCHSYLLFRN